MGRELKFDLVKKLIAERQANSGNGLGLGLTIVRHLVEQHSGTISGESFGANQEGADFRIHLPIAEIFE